MLKPALTPPDYAQAWALTHYLAQRHGEEFVKYLKAMSQIPPLEPRTPEQNLAEFRRFFGDDLTKLDKKLDDYIRKLSQKKGYDPLPYYTVIFVQPMGNGVVRRLATVRQSPQMIEQWVQERTMATRGRTKLGSAGMAYSRPSGVGTSRVDEARILGWPCLHCWRPDL